MSKSHLNQHISIQIKEDKHIMHQHIYLLALDEELDKCKRKLGEKGPLKAQTWRNDSQSQKQPTNACQG